MVIPLVLASGSSIRARLLKNANVAFSVQVPTIDEEALKQALLAQSQPPRAIADVLAEMKARRVSEKNPGAMVLGCDQVLDFNGEMISKPQSRRQALEQLREMRGLRHDLLSAAVICQDGQPVWRHIGQVHVQMRDASDAYLSDYVSRNWESIRHAVGGYKLEEEGARLFTSINGDYFHVLGMPFLEVLNFLTLRGVIAK